MRAHDRHRLFRFVSLLALINSLSGVKKNTSCLYVLFTISLMYKYLTGTLIEDFVFDSKPGHGAIGSRVLHCRNAPSPGATSSLAIAEMVVEKIEKEFKI